ncbi:uncharacterized protein METZ01_LOCUS305619, partial [marine metagenome]
MGLMLGIPSGALQCGQIIASVISCILLCESVLGLYFILYLCASRIWCAVVGVRISTPSGAGATKSVALIPEVVLWAVSDCGA